MRKFILHFICFMLFATAFYTVALMVTPAILKKNFSYNKPDKAYLHKRLREIDTFGKVEVLFIGSSHAYRGFDTRIFNAAGITSFNLSSSSQTPIQTFYLLQQYFDKLQPRMVVLEVNPLVFSMDGVESSLNVISSDTITAKTFQMAAAVQNIKIWNSLLYAWILQTAGKKKAASFTDKNNVYISGGYVERTIIRFRSNIKARNDLPILEKQTTYFKKILNYLADKPVPVLLVQAPVTSGFYTTDCSTRFNMLMQQTGLPYYNYNQLLHLSDSVYFMDQHHLNKEGVTKFNHAFLPVLQQALKAPTNNQQ